MDCVLSLHNRQRAKQVNLRLFRRVARTLVADVLRLKRSELSVSLLAASEMTRLNERFVHHAGSTDVITFDYAEKEGSPSGCLPTATVHGEILICVDEAVVQARRFRTVWQSELVRYLTHGLLHLLGHDDLTVAQRQRMKRQEDRLVRELSRRFELRQLDRSWTAAPPAPRLLPRSALCSPRPALP